MRTSSYQTSEGTKTEILEGEKEGRCAKVLSGMKKIEFLSWQEGKKGGGHLEK